MHTFKVLATDENGKKQKLIIEAESSEEAVKNIRERGLFPESVRLLTSEEGFSSALSEDLDAVVKAKVKAARKRGIMRHLTGIVLGVLAGNAVAFIIPLIFGGQTTALGKNLYRIIPLLTVVLVWGAIYFGGAYREKF